MDTMAWTPALQHLISRGMELDAQSVEFMRVRIPESPGKGQAGHGGVNLEGVLREGIGFRVVQMLWTQ
jgi:hypothetical protein